jgi:leucyl/phenylalanyl-tRNA--protein transferase
MAGRHRPMLIPHGAPPLFPDPRGADAEGLLAIGGDLSTERLLAAYGSGIFPWFEKGLPPLWWSPDPRAVIGPEHLHVSRSMRRCLRTADFEVTYDTAFERVMRECGNQRRGGTWIIPEMIEAYTELYYEAHAHSFEVWSGGELVGGLYGVQCGALFAAESMFHRRTNASKVALIVSVRSLFAAGIELYDVQFMTEHLASLGAEPIPRAEYLQRAARARHKILDLRRLQLLT